MGGPSSRLRPSFGLYAAETAILADKLRLAIAAEPLVDSAKMTISVGPSAPARGSAFAIARCAWLPDALYKASEARRNRVRQRMSC